MPVAISNPIPLFVCATKIRMIRDESLFLQVASVLFYCQLQSMETTASAGKKALYQQSETPKDLMPEAVMQSV